ncbi:PIG-L family deacetylase [Candidatus Pelagibacter sp.]|nr:PIG-L family deacetylase [Candidatus Pelagibacter sp.]
MKKILIIVAHQDDETISMGGTISKLSKQKNKIFAVSFTDGVSSRSKVEKKKIMERSESAKKASRILGFKWIKNFNLPDNELDKISLLKIIKMIEKVKNEINPDIIFTHNSSDLNIDHRLISNATITAFRPEVKKKVKEIYFFETPSSTEFNLLKNKKNFTPNYFVDIEKNWRIKLKAINSYSKEMRKYPHPRSARAIKILNSYRGSQCCIKLAEAFEVYRLVN